MRGLKTQGLRRASLLLKHLRAQRRDKRLRLKGFAVFGGRRKREWQFRHKLCKIPQAIPRSSSGTRDLALGRGSSPMKPNETEGLKTGCIKTRSSAEPPNRALRKPSIPHPPTRTRNQTPSFEPKPKPYETQVPPESLTPPNYVVTLKA